MVQRGDDEVGPLPLSGARITRLQQVSIEWMFVFALLVVVGRRLLARDSRANSSLEGLKVQTRLVQDSWGAVQKATHAAGPRSETRPRPGAATATRSSDCQGRVIL